MRALPNILFEKLPSSEQSSFRQLTSLSFLLHAWLNIDRTNKRSRGIDDISIGDFQRDLGARLGEIALKIKNRSFRFHRLKAKAIPKKSLLPSGEPRPIRIPAVRDRVVLKALQFLLMPRLARFDAPFSYGYRPNISTFHAISHARQLCQKYTHVLEADIKSYFESVDRTRLRKVLFRVQKLTSIQDLLEGALDLETEIGNEVKPADRKFFLNDDEGIPQGSALSPLLANLFLSYFDLMMAKKGWELVRYADDLIIFAQSVDDAKKADQQAREIMQVLGLDMHPLLDGPAAKTRLRAIKTDGVEFVGYRIQSGQLQPGPKSMAHFRKDIENITDVKSIGRGYFGGRGHGEDNLITRAIAIKRKVQGKAASLAHCDPCQEIAQLSEIIKKRYLGMFQIVGMTVDIKDVAKAKVLGTPDLALEWINKNAEAKADAPIVVPQADDAILWAKKMGHEILRVFSN